MSYRNHLDILTDIDQTLKAKQLESERLILEETIKYSTNGSEICLKAGSTLLTLKNNKEVALAIGKQIDELVAYCHAIGLFPQPRDLNE